MNKFKAWLADAKVYLSRLAEEAALAGVAAGGAALLAGGDLSTAGLWLAAAAAGRAALGVLVKRIGDRERPSLGK